MMNTTNNNTVQQMGFHVPTQTGLTRYHSPRNPTAAALHNPTILAAAAADAAESGLTFNSLLLSVPPALEPQQKQRRVPSVAVAQQQNPSLEVSSYFQQQLLETDRLIADHMERLRAEVWQRRSGFLRRLAAAMVGRLKTMEEEIEQVRSLNAALEERVRALSVESQIRRDVAQSNEATAQTLRNDLEAALIQQQLSSRSGPDAESCCDNGRDGGGDECECQRTRWRASCRGCAKGEATVLLLPCRHLCLCSACASRAQECVLCGCGKQCTVHVNFS